MKHIADAIAKLMSEKQAQRKARTGEPESPRSEQKASHIEEEKSKLHPEELGDVADQLCPACGSKLKGHMAEKASLPAHDPIHS